MNMHQIKELMEEYPAPWSIGEGWEQTDPGYYICDSRGRLVVATSEVEMVSREVMELIVLSINEKYCRDMEVMV